jgi:hypothetical protein
VPLRIDRDNPNLGRYSATRRVARTLYLGSAPTLRAANKGLEDRSIKLGCVQPGETVSTFGDALRRLVGGATHLYENGQRYWFSTQPSVNRLAQDRAEQQREDTIEQEIVRRLKEDVRQRGDFAGVHLVPASSADVSDEREVRLVVLGPLTPHVPPSKQSRSEAREAAKAILAGRGGSPRRYQNMLAFLAPDATRLEELTQAVRQYLAWKSINDEAETLNLDAFQRRQAETRRNQADETVKQRIPETYVWLLVPAQPKDADERPILNAPVEWEELRLQGADPIIVRASKRMRNDGLLITQFGGIPLRLELDRIPLWRSDHVGVKQLADYFAEYLYLPRLRDSTVLLGAIAQGLGMLTWEESFAYAERVDPDSGRYQGLVFAQARTVALDEYGVLIKPEAANRQLEADAEAQRRREAAAAAEVAANEPLAGVAPSLMFEERSGYSVTGAGALPPAEVTVRPRRLRRYHGAARLNTLKVATEASAIAEEILQHLAGLPGAQIRVTLEITATLPDGAPDHVVRTVTENSRVLKLESYGFEEE